MKITLTESMIYNRLLAERVVTLMHRLRIKSIWGRVVRNEMRELRREVDRLNRELRDANIALANELRQTHITRHDARCIYCGGRPHGAGDSCPAFDHGMYLGRN